MENYSYNSYPDSGHSSPRSREIEFENPTPWEDQSQQQQPQDYKAKFMCSYGGKIHPRPHDNQLSYIGGETKILAVDRNIKFSVMISKLAAVCGDTDISFKYQLSGEDLDALISVTNDDDLEHMMHEYDRLYRASAKPARMRLFLFPVNPSPASFGSEGSKSERDRFVEALNSAPCHVPDTNKPPPNNVDFLFGLDKGVPTPPPQVKVPDLPEVHVGVGHDDRVIGSDPVNLQTQLQRIQIREQEQQTMYRKNSDDNLVAGYPGEYYVQKLPDKVPPVTSPVTVAPTLTAPTGYWPEKQIATGGYQPSAVTVTTTPAPLEQQQFYVFPGPAQGTVYHTQVMRPVTSQTGQPYYMQRMGGPDVYREQPVYNMVPQQQQQPPQISAATGPMGVVRPSGAGVGVTDTGYAPVAYDSTVGRQVYYTAQGGVMQAPPSYQGVGGMPVSGEMRHIGGGGL
ncbi:hypothetical protein P3X46_024768 [Hevea brasiliensis]|uniref:PB1 domain-containing protein n=1 Tax=Hevea brasiliensis TaxID=3981 RepID=A0ABQ9L4L5_HEVBR|nr:uncharacterized protein LOC110646887 [Hevea brasiliensis]KAJ9159251.1 hypothetical protein P3X46_024768 [Hevea brasiliensis]